MKIFNFYFDYHTSSGFVITDKKGQKNKQFYDKTAGSCVHAKKHNKIEFKVERSGYMWSIQIRDDNG